MHKKQARTFNNQYTPTLFTYNLGDQQQMGHQSNTTTGAKPVTKKICQGFPLFQVGGDGAGVVRPNPIHASPDDPEGFATATTTSTTDDIAGDRTTTASIRDRSIAAIQRKLKGLQ